MAKCPGCERPFSNLSAEHTEISVPNGRTWHGIVYMCPVCRTAVGAEIDPITLKADIVNEVVAALRK